MFRLSRVFCNQASLKNYAKNSCRTLYSVNILGVDGFVEKRGKVKQFFLNDADKFREKMNGFIENEGTSMIFTEDLKNMIHLADPNDMDLHLLERMLSKFSKQSKEMRFGNFVFGPVVMRFFHHINNPDMALKLFKDPEFDGFFDQLISYQILVDLLYEAGRYKDVTEVYQMIRSRQIQGGMHPKHVVMLVFAACYKENTPESFKFLTDLWAELNNIGHVPLRRTITFAAALALKQNVPAVALEIAGTARHQHYVTVRNIKVLAFTKLGRVDDVIPILKAVLQLQDTPEKHSFCKDVMDEVKETVNKNSDKELVQNFNKLEKYLSENGHVIDKTLDDLLTTEVTSSLNPQEFRKDRNVLAASYNSNSRGTGRGSSNWEHKKPHFGSRTSNTNNRPGLDDLY